MARIKLKYVNAFANRRRKNERVRYYFRRRGFKAIPLPGLPGSEEFMTAYQMALAAIPDQERPERREPNGAWHDQRAGHFLLQVRRVDQFGGRYAKLSPSHHREISHQARQQARAATEPRTHCENAR